MFFVRTLLVRLRYNSALPLPLRPQLHLFRFLPTATRITASELARQAFVTSPAQPEVPT